MPDTVAGSTRVADEVSFANWAKGINTEVGVIVFLDPKRMLGVGGSLSLDHHWVDDSELPNFLPMARSLVMFTTPGEGFGFRIEGGFATPTTVVRALAWAEPHDVAGAMVSEFFRSVRGRPRAPAAPLHP